MLKRVNKNTLNPKTTFKVSSFLEISTFPTQPTTGRENVRKGLSFQPLAHHIHPPFEATWG